MSSRLFFELTFKRFFFVPGVCSIPRWARSAVQISLTGCVDNLWNEAKEMSVFNYLQLIQQ